MTDHMQTTPVFAAGLTAEEATRTLIQDSAHWHEIKSVLSGYLFRSRCLSIAERRPGIFILCHFGGQARYGYIIKLSESASYIACVEEALKQPLDPMGDS